MEKIGINKCSKEDVQFFSKYIFNDDINIYDINIKQISSCIIENQILDYEFLEHIEMIKIIIKVNIKIIYSKYDSNLLYIYDKSSLLVQYVNFPKYVDGNSSKNLFLKDKAKINIFIENISINSTQENLLINYIAIIKVDVFSDFYIGLNIDNGLGDNIFLAYKNSDKITQITFDLGNKYNEILFLTDDTRVSYIQENEDINSIIINDFKYKKNHKLQNYTILKDINSFKFINKHKIILTATHEGIFTYDFKTDILEKTYSTDLCKAYSNINFDSKSKTSYFLSVLNDCNCLCKLSKRGEFEIITNNLDVLDYIVDTYFTNALIIANKNNSKCIFLLNLISKTLNFININLKYDDIIKIKFYVFNKYEKKIIMLISNENKMRSIVLYNINNMMYEVLYEGEDIVDLEIDEYTLDIYIAIQFNDFSEIIKLEKSKYTRENILKLPGKIKNIFIKKHTY